MIEGRTILCFASGYDAPPTSKHHVMHLLAERNVVLWVNYHASRAPTTSASDLRCMARKVGQIFRGITNPRRNLYVLTPPVLPLPGSALAKRINRRLLIARIRSALKRVARGPVQVWSFTPDISYLLGHFGEEKVVYYCVDDFASFSGYNREQVLRDEADLCRRADLVVAVSRALQEAKAPLNPNTVLVTHGVDYEHFSRAVREDLPVPEDMKGIPHPVLGFFGLIRDWVDLELLTEVARRRSAWHIVLLGDATVDLAPYRGLPNMHFLGRKRYEDLPAYARCFDAGLVPFKISSLTEAASPIKLREYLAAGLPVVSSLLFEATSPRDGVYIGAGIDAFLSAADAAMRSNGAARLACSESVAGETWPRQLEIIAEQLNGPRAPEGEGSPWRDRVS